MGEEVAVVLEPPRPKSWVDRVLPLVHLFTMLGLAIFAVFVYEPAKRQDILTLSGADAVDDGLGLRGSISWRGWARLAGERGRVGPSAQGVPIKDSVVGLLSGGGLAVVVRATLNAPLTAQPFFYFFVTAELLLQSSRLVLSQRLATPQLGMLGLALPYLPPQVKVLVHTGLKYWALLATLLDDLAVLLLFIGLLIAVADWRAPA